MVQRLPFLTERLFLVALLLLSAVARLPAVYGPAITGDEVITLLETAGHALPAWPAKPTPAGVSREIFRGTPTFGDIVAELQHTDVHPPLYFWLLTLWRRWFGYSIETARLFSLACSLGALLFFYRLLRAKSLEMAWIGTAVAALAPGLIFSGTSARPYALATFLLSAAAFFAYRGSRAPGSSSMPSITDSAGMAVCCGLAVQTNYLTLFSVAAILSWSLICLWRRRKAYAIFLPALVLSIAIIALPVLARQLGARPDQESGLRPLGPEIKTLAKMTLMVTFLPDYSKDPVSYGTAIAVAALAALAVYQLLRNWRTVDRGFWLLLSALAAAPAIGIILLNSIFDKFLQAPRYLTFAGLPIAALVSYPVVRMSRGRLWGASILVAFLAFRTVSAYANEAAQPGMRKLARALRTSSAGSQIVVLDPGWGRGITGSLIYELDRGTDLVVLQGGMAADDVMSQIRGYDDVWLFSSFSPETASVREGLRAWLTGPGGYYPLPRDPRFQDRGPWPSSVIHCRRVDEKGRSQR